MYTEMKKNLVLVLFCLVFLGCSAQEKLASEVQTGSIDFMKKVLSGAFTYRMTGEIVDPQGNLLKDVSVLSSTSTQIMDGPSQEETHLVKDGKFTFSVRGALMWGLTFKKEKYYTVTVGFSGPGVSRMLAEGEAKLEGNVIVRKVKVVLYPRGELDKHVTEVEQKTLHFSRESGLSTIQGITIPYNYYAKDETHRYTFKNEEDLPPQLIYIVPGKKEDGSNDGSIILKTNVPDSGFQVLEYQGDYFFRGMQEAPEDGYQPELVIRKEFGNFHQKDPYVVFYFRVMNYYGKGLITTEDFRSSLSADKASLAIYACINTKAGGRNTNRWFGTKW